MKGDGTKLEHSHSAKKSLKCFSEKMSACIQCCHEDGTLERAAANLPRSHCDTLPVAHIIVTSAGPEPTVHAFFYYSSGVISRFAERTKKKKKRKEKSHMWNFSQTDWNQGQQTNTQSGHYF